MAKGKSQEKTTTKRKTKTVAHRGEKGAEKRKQAAARDQDQETKKRSITWETDSDTQRGLLIILLFAVAALSFLSFINAAGDFGVWIDGAMGWIFGWGRYVTPLIFAGLGYAFLNPDKYSVRIQNYVGIILFLFSGLALLDLAVPLGELTGAARDGRGGGYIGIALFYPLMQFTGVWATVVILVGVFVASFLVMFHWSLEKFIDRIAVFGFLRPVVLWFRSRAHAYRNGYSIEPDQGEDGDREQLQLDEEMPELADDERSPAFTAKEIAEIKQAAATGTEPPEQLSFIPKKTKRHLKIDIPFSLLINRNEKPTSGDIEANKEKIRRAMESFGINVEMSDVSVGPMVSQYTLKPAEGVKLTQITTLHNDIALALAAHPIRIEAPIPGKSLVGIEVPNKATATVSLREMLESKPFKQRKDNLSVCLGKDVSGKSYVTSLSSMPHLLIAGATGSGKSVCINGVIVSLLYQNSPDDLRLIMVDPKRVELTVYNGVPHLLTPVITDVEKTINALKWTVSEMDRRYELLSRAGKRNIESFNQSVQEDERLPYIVFIIDELADLMSVAANSVEAAIVRLAQMSRAVGIHLVLATQRPSVNVITGLIKANMPARIAFSVTSLVDSRTILDFSGAEKLLGRGDMLYIDAQISKPKRLQGAFLDDKEIENVVQYLREQGDPDYEQDVTEKSSKANISGADGGFDGDGDSDELLDQAKEVIVQAGKASASLLQRRLRVGYARAARILDILEEQGFIGPADGAKPREILGAGEGMEMVEGMDIAESDHRRSSDAIDDETDDDNDRNDLPDDDNGDDSGDSGRDDDTPTDDYGDEEDSEDVNASEDTPRNAHV